LDTIGGNYHHGGPYDATLTSRNLNSKYSPVAAVKDSNRDALRATPRENVLDSLNFHVPLQGTASIPPGGVDMSGNVMDYTEGADLMREPDAAGGPYKRWDGIVSHRPLHPVYSAEKDSNIIPTISRARGTLASPLNETSRSTTTTQASRESSCGPT
ncbi:hypothetical protein FNE72_29140, partial [Klebsiella pneumoniae]|uniref:hypothetical protein n=1 Tax=Klebsiella pneumoniae TaxID=573 RepID=UPI00124BB879